MQSSSTSNSFRTSYLHILYCSIYLLLLDVKITKGSRFNPLIQLPTNELYRNISRTVLLCIDDFGAKGDGFSDDTESLQNVWEAACSSSSKAKILIPSGKSYLVRPTNLAGPCLSKVTLRVSGFIVAPKDPAVWKGLDVHKWLYFHGVKRLKVEGGGIIDGNGKEWWKRSCKTNDSNPCTHAPMDLTFHRCQNLKVANITFFNSQQMHLAFTHCKRVVASHANIFAPADSPNTDGIHISASTHVELKDIAIRTGSGFARKIKFENIYMHNVSNPIIINQFYCDSPVTCTNQTSAVKIESVTFRGISGISATEDAIVLACSDSYPCKKLYLKDIQLTTLSGTAKSFCWEAYGRSSGMVYLKPCLSSGDMIIRHLVKSNATGSREYDYALF